MTSDDDDAGDAATSAGAGPTDETTVVPAPTEAAPALAWSLDEGEDSMPVERHHWGVAWGQAAVFLSIGAVIATVTAVVSWVLMHHDKRETQLAAPTPTPPTVAMTATPPPASQPPAPPIAAAPLTTTTTKPPLPVAIEGSACRLESTPTVDPDGVPVYCALFPDMPETAMCSRTRGPLAWPTIGGVRVPDQEGSYPWVVVCEQQTGRTYNYCDKAIAQATYQGDGLLPES